MNWPEPVRRWLAGIVGALGVYGTLAGLGLLPLPAAVVAIALGAASGQVVAALFVALVGSLVVNVVLGVYFWRHRRRHNRRPSRASVPWPTIFTDPDDLSTIAITSTDLEAWWANALRAARLRIAPDAALRVDRINFFPMFVVFDGQSTTAGRTFKGSVVGPDPSHVSWWHVYRTQRPWSDPPEQPLWRTDETWLDLIKLAWLQERPIRRDWDLYQLSNGRERYWSITCRTYVAHDDSIVPARRYRLSNGKLAAASA